TSPFAVSADSTDVTCNAAKNGTATANALGGVSPYTYNWSNSATTQTISGLAPGTYCVTITDAEGCTGTDCTSVNQPGAIELLMTCVHNQCIDQCEGKIFITVIGGTPPYNYHWSNGGTADSIVNLCTALYFLTVTDANQCSLVGDF